MKTLLKDLTELINAKVISDETAEKIRDYYSVKQMNGQSRQQLALGILGSVLVGLGIILIIAHNWDDLTPGSKTLLAFLPLLLGQFAGGYVLLKLPGNYTWRESVAAFLFFSVGACLVLISQVYNIPGDLDSFLLTWMLLVLPIIYVFKASAISIFYQIGITCYACLVGYGNSFSSGFTMYWLCLLLIIPIIFI
jgi:uncharacterized membrane protein